MARGPMQMHRLKAGPGLLTSEVCFFHVLRHTEYSWSCAQTLPLHKNASALVVAESENG